MSNLIDLHKLVVEECDRRGLDLVNLPKKLVRRSTDVTVSCPCSGQRNMSIRNFIAVAEKGDEAFCCKRKSKLGKNNPAFGKPTWNAGTSVYQRVMDSLDLKRNGLIERIICILLRPFMELIRLVDHLME